MSADIEKLNAAVSALDYIENGMVVGLGSGSTAETFVRLLGASVKDGLEITGLPTSEQTRSIALDAGVPIIPVDKAEKINVTVDGADEVDSGYNLIKGGGGCLFREKIIAQAADLMVVIIDESKLVKHLGTFPLAIEVDPFAFTLTAGKIFKALQSTGCKTPEIKLREKLDGRPFVTDGGHYIFDCHCRKLDKPAKIAESLTQISGVIEHGLFINLARIVLVGELDGVRVLEK